MVNVLPELIVRLLTCAFVLMIGFIPDAIIAFIYLLGTPLLQFEAVFQLLVIPDQVVFPMVGSTIVIELEEYVLE
jgi:hypothetical protein